MVCAVCHRLLDAYSMPADSGRGDASSKTLLNVLGTLQERAKAELRVQDNLISLKGMLDSILVTGSA